MVNPILPRHLLTTIVVALGLVFGATGAQAQTPAATIENSEGEIRLQLNHNGGFVVPGEVVTDGTENDSIPATGDGARMMWYPEKGAFRAGVATSNQWNADDVGFFSTAMGMGTTASHNSSTAIGRFTTASGYVSTAIGHITTAAANYSTAMGRETNATSSSSTAMGYGTTASGYVSTAMGRDTEASANQSTAMGFNTVAATDYSLSAGAYNEANQSDDGTLFVVGNGTGDSDRSDALVLDENGELEIAGNLTESSDRRLKTGIEPLGEDVLDALDEIRPVRFHFREDTGHPTGRQLGLIAQQVEEHFPELVREGTDGHLSLAYPKLSAVLLKGLQEQQNEIEAKEERIAHLEAESEAIKAQNEGLEARLSALEDKVAGDQPPAAAGPAGSALGFLLVFALGGLVGIGLHRRRQT